MSKRFKAVFLDRDGTILKHKHYLKNVKDVKLYKTAPKALKILKENGFKLVVVTNQSGVARGYISIEKLKKINRKMQKILEKKGIKLDGIFYCPHHPDENCACRKPRIGLIKLAAKKLKIDIKNSYIIGDNKTDILTAKNAGMKAGLLLLTGLGKKQKINALKFRNILEAAKWIVENFKK